MLPTEKIEAYFRGNGEKNLRYLRF